MKIVFITLLLSQLLVKKKIAKNLRDWKIDFRKEFAARARTAQPEQPDSLFGEPRFGRSGQYEEVFCQLSAAAGASGRQLVNGVQWLPAASGHSARHRAEQAGWRAKSDAGGGIAHRQLHRQLPEYNECPGLFQLLRQVGRSTNGQILFIDYYHQVNTLFASRNSSWPRCMQYRSMPRRMRSVSHSS